MNAESSNELERRLQSLSASLGDDPEFIGRVLSRIETEGAVPDDIRSIQIRRWIMRGSIGLVAALLVAAFVWSLLLTSPRQAFAMDEVSKRVLSLDSLHIKGTIYPPDGSPGRPFEVFVQQPDHYRINGYLSSMPQGNKSTDMIITPEQSVTIDDSTQTATIVPGNAQDAKSRVAQILQGLGQMMFGQSPGFKKLRSENLAGISTDVYENRIDPHSRIDIWLNPVTDLPVQTEMHEISPGKPDRLAFRFDTIEANPTLGADIFTPTFGPGWTITYPKATPDTDSLAHNSIRFGSMCLSVRHTLSLGKGNVLICWCLFDTSHPGNDMNLPDGIKKVSFEALGGTSFTEHLLHADPTSRGFHWRWSLLRPNHVPSGSMIVLSVTATTTRGDSGQDESIAEISKPEDLPKQVQDLQKQTLPEGKPPMTLEEIESLEQK